MTFDTQLSLLLKGFVDSTISFSSLDGDVAAQFVPGKRRVSDVLSS